MLNSLFTRLYDRVFPLNSLGARGERVAERFLLKRGLIICERSYSERSGEIDLIAVDDETIVFVEVKTRTSDFAGNPVEAVDENKQKKITRVALSYLKRHDLLECRSRFDVVAISWQDQNRPPSVEFYESAFEAVGNSF